MRKKFSIILTLFCLLFSLCAIEACKPGGKSDLDLISREIVVCTGESSNIVVQSSHAEKIEYTSLNTAVASVSADGKVTGVAEGRTFVFVKLGEKQEICKVTVQDNTNAIILGNEKINLAVGSEMEWTAVVYRNSQPQDETVSWKISDAEKCEFSFDGNTAKFKATQTGEFTLTATSGDLSATCRIRVVSENAKRLDSPVVTAECGGSVSWDEVTDANGYALYLNGEYCMQTKETQADIKEYTSALKAGERLFVAVEAVAGDNYDYIDSLPAICKVVHKYQMEKLGDVSCKKYGDIKYTCSECNHTYTDKNVLAEHTWNGDTCAVCGFKGVKLTITNELLGWKRQPGATEYAVLVNGEQVGKTTATNFDLSGCFDLTKDGEYSVDVHPVGAQSMFVTGAVNVICLNNSNFMAEMSRQTNAYTYYVLTEDVSISHIYSEGTLHDADGFLPADQLCSSPVEGLKNAVFDGRGHRITVSFDGTPKTNDSWEIMGGLFGYTENALIRNLRTDIAIQQSGHLHRIFSSGALVAVMKDDARIEDCYIKSRITLNSGADYDANGGYGAVAGIVRSGKSLSIIERCVIDSAMYNTAIGAPKAIVGVMDTDVLVTNNAYIVNEPIPNRDAQMQETYQEVFLSWTLHSQNWLFASLSDFMFGNNGDYCDYNATGAWEFKWTYDCNPKAISGTRKLYESAAWKGTTFTFDGDFKLCGESVL